MPANLTFKKDHFCLEDQLGFDRYVKTLADMIKDENFDTPFCIGIHGPWGSGKTSFMRQLEAALVQSDSQPVPIPVWFNPWRYSKEEHLIIPFLKTIAAELSNYQKTIRDNDTGIRVKNSLRKAAIDISTAARAIAYGVKVNFFGLALSGKDMVEREQKIKEGNSDELSILTENLAEIYYSIIEHLQKAVEDDQFRLVVFIDDLDRCLPEKGVELLEAMKLFLDLKGYCFILGVDRAVVEEGIRQHYKYRHKTESNDERNPRPELAGKYLEKMIQMGLELPPVEPSRKRGLIEKLLENSTLKDYAPLIEYGIAGRPREITRFINYLAFFCRLAENLKHVFGDEPENAGKPDDWEGLIETYFSPEFYTKWAIFVFSYHSEYLQTIQVNNHFFELQQAARTTTDQHPSGVEEKKQAGVSLPSGLGKVLAYGKAFAEDPWLIRKYIYLADSVSEVMTETSGKENLPRRHKNKTGLLSAIGEMVKVPRGPFLYGEEKEERNIEKDFEIDIYPVTNGQFCSFLNDRYQGVQEPRDAENNLIIYQNSSKIRFDKSFVIDNGYEDHPVTGVTWNGAMNFCDWRTLKNATEDVTYRLLTELEWEKAARGDNGNDYPWGNEFVLEKCNTEESQSKGTTEVTKYPDGISPYGCFDMAGNVWEWTLSEFESDIKAIRGGSWLNDRSAARCAARSRNIPNFRDLRCGFSLRQDHKINVVFYPFCFYPSRRRRSIFFICPALLIFCEIKQILLTEERNS